MLGYALKQIMLRSFKSVEDGNQTSKQPQSASRILLAMLMNF